MRQNTVSGSFYPADLNEAERMITDFSQTNKPLKNKLLKKLNNKTVKALIVPHAGWTYSGQLAQLGFELCAGQQYQKIIILAPNHTKPLDLAVFSSDSTWQGLFQEQTVIIPETKTGILENDNQAHLDEHAIEVQIPFIQKYWPQAKILPIIVGQITNEQVTALVAILQKKLTSDTLLVISSDLSHYLSVADSLIKDNKTIQDILNLDKINILNDDLCGINPVKILLELATQNNWQPILADSYNSSKTSGDTSGVVGYTTILFT